MASEADRRELIQKVTRLVSKRYGGTGIDAWRRGFAAFDLDGDGVISADELGALLKGAGVGNGFTRGAWVKGVLSELNVNHDSGISLAELLRVVSVAEPKPKPKPRPSDDEIPFGQPTAVVDVYGPRRGPPDDPAPYRAPPEPASAAGTIIVLVLLGLALALRYGR
jgi:hypothetical protein